MAATRTAPPRGQDPPMLADLEQAGLSHTQMIVVLAAIAAPGAALTEDERELLHRYETAKWADTPRAA